MHVTCATEPGLFDDDAFEAVRRRRPATVYGLARAAPDDKLRHPVRNGREA